MPSLLPLGVGSLSCRTPGRAPASEGLRMGALVCSSLPWANPTRIAVAELHFLTSVSLFLSLQGQWQQRLVLEIVTVRTR